MDFVFDLIRSTNWADSIISRNLVVSAKFHICSSLSTDVLFFLRRSYERASEASASVSAKPTPHPVAFAVMSRGAANYLRAEARRAGRVLPRVFFWHKSFSPDPARPRSSVIDLQALR